MSLEPAHSTDVFGLQRLREGTHDTDTTWMPRSGTAETEATAVGTFEVPETEIGGFATLVRDIDILTNI